MPFDGSVESPRESYDALIQLRAARAEIADPEKWIKYDWTTSSGRHCSVGVLCEVILTSNDRSSAHECMAYSSMWLAEFDHEKAMIYLFNSLPWRNRVGYLLHSLDSRRSRAMCIVRYNDRRWRVHKDIVRLFDRAIKRAARNSVVHGVRTAHCASLKMHGSVPWTTS